MQAKMTNGHKITREVEITVNAFKCEAVEDIKLVDSASKEIKIKSSDSTTKIEEATIKAYFTITKAEKLKKSDC